MSKSNLTRSEALVHRFFDIFENGGLYVELFLIRDMLCEDYINGEFSQVCIVQIDDLIEEYIMPRIYEEGNNKAVNVMLDAYVDMIYDYIEEGDIDKAFEMINVYGDCKHHHPYIYYCMVREMERISGETLIELCI